jgi:hypothetical protein
MQYVLLSMKGHYLQKQNTVHVITPLIFYKNNIWNNIKILTSGGLIARIGRHVENWALERMNRGKSRAHPPPSILHPQQIPKWGFDAWIQSLHQNQNLDPGETHKKCRFYITIFQHLSQCDTFTKEYNGVGVPGFSYISFLNAWEKQELHFIWLVANKVTQCTSFLKGTVAWNGFLCFKKLLSAFTENTHNGEKRMETDHILVNFG